MTRKRLNLLWRQDDWERLERVRLRLGEESDTATLRRALQITEAILEGRGSIDGRPVVTPQVPV